MTATLHVNETALSNISNNSKSFFLNPTTLYLLTVGVEGYYCAWPHSMICKHTGNDTHHTHIHRHSHPVRSLWLKNRSSQGPLPVNTKHSQERDIHVTGGIRMRNPRKPSAAEPHLRPRGHRLRVIAQN
jgi:hypothetical protein